MSDTAPAPVPPEPERELLGSTSGVIIAVVGASLLFGGCIMCGGGLSIPLVFQRQRRAEEAARRAQAEHNLEQMRNAMQKRAEQDSIQRPEAGPVDGTPTEQEETR